MRVLELLALSIWVGAMTAFAFIFAPIAFHTIPDLDVFARLIAQTISNVTYVGFACALLIAIAIAATPHSRTRNARAVCLLLMLASSIYELFVVMPTMQQMLLHAGGSIAALVPQDPRRVAYDQLHHLSSLVYSMTLLAGYVLLVLRAADTADATQVRRTPPSTI